jgi:hypothetical protein
MRTVSYERGTPAGFRAYGQRFTGVHSSGIRWGALARGPLCRAGYGLRLRVQGLGVGVTSPSGPGGWGYVPLRSWCPLVRGLAAPREPYLTESVFKVVWQKSIPAQICQLDDSVDLDQLIVNKELSLCTRVWRPHAKS